MSHATSGLDLEPHYHFVSARIAAGKVISFLGADAVLFEKLRALFAGEYEPNALHRLLAALPEANRRQGSEHPCQLIITTNYDDALERAFVNAGEEIDVVYYAATRQQA